MAEDKGRCTWFEDEWTDENGKSKAPVHTLECPYSKKYYVGNNRCLFHMPKDAFSKEDTRQLFKKLEKLLREGRVTWEDPEGNKYLDLFGFVFPNGFNFSSILNNLNVRHHLCLIKAQLEGVELNTFFQGMNFSFAQLQGAYLSGARLQGENLTGARLQGANLSWAQLQGANFSLAQLQGAYFESAQLQGANLIGVQLQGAYLWGASLQGAMLHFAQLQGANLQVAHLQGANLYSALLLEADLKQAHLQGANLQFARLQGATLALSDLQGVNFEGAVFSSDPTYRINPEWEKWINRETFERMENGLVAADLRYADFGEGLAISIDLSKIKDIDLRKRIIKSIVENVETHGALTVDRDKGNGYYLLNTLPAKIGNSDLRGVDLSNSNIAGTDFSGARLEGTIFRGTKFGKNAEDEDIWNSRWYRRNRWERSKPPDRFRNWLTKLPLIGRLFVLPELPIFNGANIEAADWADNRLAQRNFVYAEYIRQFKKTHPIIAKIWWLFADYGRSLKRWAIWSLGFAAAFGAIYHWGLGQDSFVVVKEAALSPILRSFYYSVVTFTTLGFGDIVPKTDPAAFWVALEVALGYVMLGGLISIFAVKIARRD